MSFHFVVLALFWLVPHGTRVSGTKTMAAPPSLNTEEETGIHMWLFDI